MAAEDMAAEQTDTLILDAHVDLAVAAELEQVVDAILAVYAERNGRAPEPGDIQRQLNPEVLSHALSADLGLAKFFESTSLDGYKDFRVQHGLCSRVEAAYPPSLDDMAKLFGCFNLGPEGLTDEPSHAINLLEIIIDNMQRAESDEQEGYAYYQEATSKAKTKFAGVLDSLTFKEMLAIFKGEVDLAYILLYFN